MLWEQGDIDEKVILKLFFNLRDDKGLEGGWKIDIQGNPLGSPLTPLVGLEIDTSQVTRFKNWRRATHDSSTWS